MMKRARRGQALLIVAGAQEIAAVDEPRSTAELRPDTVVCGVHGGRAYLRVATAVGTDLVLIDGRCPRGLEGLLREPSDECQRQAGGSARRVLR